MSMEHPSPPPALIRIPVRIVVLAIVLPVRMAWDALTASARLLDRTLLRPTGRGLAWLFHHTLTLPARWLYRCLLAPVGRGLARVFTGLGRGLAWVFTGVGRGLAWVFTGVGRGLAWFFVRVGRGLAALGRGIAVGAGWLWRGASAAGVWLGKAVFVWPWVGLWRYLVVPVCRYGIAVPAAWLNREVLTRLGGALLFLLEKLVFVPLAALFRYLLVPLFRYGVAVPAVWLDRYVLSPLGRGIGWSFRQAGRGLAWFFPRVGHGLAVTALWLGRAVFVWPWAGLWRYVVVPLVRYGIVVPVAWLWTRVLAPVGREVRGALAMCWRVAGFVSRAVGRALKWVAWNLVGRPFAWAWTRVVRPAGRWARDHVWTPARRIAAATGRAAREALASTRATVREALASTRATVREALASTRASVREALGSARASVREALGSARASVREARRDAWRVLVGGARMTEPGEPEVARARTLGSTTNVPGAAPGPEISLRKRG
ncbi:MULTISPECIES: hypothetical protein [Streptomyces]|uniref:Uncharacterized protein n=1 Tax=Streptomyces viridochromogenes TaxID=1938 RepID=A0A0L8JVX7_STRVR|nr:MULTISPECIES: hypothetical protein [Streptomyces]KOG17803.1 hypothetical protein ADK34_25210 [Streptomyces viridochromogenes]